MRPGSAEVFSGRWKTLAGFNEAGAHAPRKRRRATPASRPASGFNEAGAHAPRKPRSRTRSSSSISRFNEAGAHAPRKQAMMRDVVVAKH